MGHGGTRIRSATAPLPRSAATAGLDMSEMPNGNLCFAKSLKLTYTPDTMVQWQPRLSLNEKKKEKKRYNTLRHQQQTGDGRKVSGCVT